MSAVLGVTGPGLIPARAGKTRPAGSRSVGSGAHPRACGENEPNSSRISSAAGSSPRVRGKRCCPDWPTSPGGLIPARAGKTAPPSTPPRQLWAHPRACGENSLQIGHQLPSFGSSPRVRGKLDRGDDRRPRRRLIPARAGKTPPGRRASSRPAAHPRACGENRQSMALTAHKKGSSPRVRGKPVFTPAVPAEDRLIPARAGKTRSPTPSTAPRLAHPRACGEN